MTLTLPARPDRARLASAAATFSGRLLASTGQYLLTGLTCLGMTFYPEGYLPASEEYTSPIITDALSRTKQLLGPQSVPVGQFAMATINAEELVG